MNVSNSFDINKSIRYILNSRIETMTRSMGIPELNADVNGKLKALYDKVWNAVVLDAGEDVRETLRRSHYAK